MKPEKRDQVNLVWVLGGLYLVYTGCEMLYRLLAGEAEMAAVSGVGGLIFLLVGGLMLLREWKAYQTQKRGDQEEEREEEGGEEP